MTKVLPGRMRVSWRNLCGFYPGGKFMFTDDEKDYIMRMIKEIARVLASVMLGKKYVQAALQVHMHSRLIPRP